MSRFELFSQLAGLLGHLIQHMIPSIFAEIVNNRIQVLKATVNKTLLVLGEMHIEQVIKSLHVGSWCPLRSSF
jgi:hypothetical protein